jgi:hypothetical protein
MKNKIKHIPWIISLLRSLFPLNVQKDRVAPCLLIESEIKKNFLGEGANERA